jgi:2-C-methyl-D-erythritol 2,4-cyclodiphosphate synthase
VTDQPRVGLGFDVHALDPARPLLLGGVLFEGSAGLTGHSDGDVVCHALADAMLGAAVLADLGAHFPDTDPAFAGIAGLDLLARSVALVHAARLVAASVDLTVIAATPSIASQRGAMRERLAGTLGIAIDRVSVKATRPEGLGLSGEGIGCLALAVLTPS